MIGAVVLGAGVAELCAATALAASSVLLVDMATTTAAVAPMAITTAAEERIRATDTVTSVTGDAAVTKRDRPRVAGPVRVWQGCSMVLEVANITVTDGSADAFAAAYRGAREVLRSTPGCRSVRMTHGIESPNRFVLLVEWDSVAAHEENFRATDRYGQWRGAIGPFFDGPPNVEHFADVD
jgi:heme-degrading monooxygenase HmoA